MKQEQPGNRLPPTAKPPRPRAKCLDEIEERLTRIEKQLDRVIRLLKQAQTEKVLKI